jgi:hypothetical protein
MDVPAKKPTIGAPPGTGKPTDRKGGELIVLIFSPASLTADQRSKVEGIIGPLDDSMVAQDIKVNERQIEAIQKKLFPYPDKGASVIGGRKWIPMRAQPADGITPKPVERSSRMFVIPLQNPAYPRLSSEKSRLTTVRQFCRFLVLMGVIFGTVFVIFSAYGLVQGHRDAAGRLTFSAGGLILLLGAYIIWKIDMLNTHYYENTVQQVNYGPPNTYPATSKEGSSSAQAPLSPNDTPDPRKGGGRGAPRSNMPVSPLGASSFR